MPRFGFIGFKMSLHTTGYAVASPDEKVGIRSDLDQRAGLAAALNDKGRATDRHSNRERRTAHVDRLHAVYMTPPMTLMLIASTAMLKTKLRMLWASVVRRICAVVTETSETCDVMPKTNE